MRSTQKRESHPCLRMTQSTDLNNRAKAIWDFEGIHCTSRHIPGVKFAGLIHPGILGCAPSPEILQLWNKREAELIQTTDLKRVVALPPLEKNVHAGSAGGDIKSKVGREGARTIPGRPEHGGNCDIKNLSRGSKVYLPVHVKGAKFSVGDLHFSQGDGEVSDDSVQNANIPVHDHLSCCQRQEQCFSCRHCLHVEVTSSSVACEDLEQMY